jgi:hypothetical protein
MTATPMCSWEGVEGDDDERVVSCDKPATVTIEADGGARYYACDEHISEVRSKAGGGTVLRGAQHLNDEGRLKVSPESAVHWE